MSAGRDRAMRFGLSIRASCGILVGSTAFFAACGSEDNLLPGPPPTTPPGNGSDPRWTTARSLPERLQEMHGAVLDGLVYIAGGIAAANVDSDRAYRYDPESDAWERIADLPAPRHHMPLAVANDSLYAIGGLVTGLQSFDPNANLWLYDVANDQWESRAPMLEARGASAVGVVDGRIIVVGGFGAGSQLLATAAIYDPGSDSWSSGAPIPTPRDHLTAAAVDGVVYAIGGRSISLGSVMSNVEAYDADADEWTALSPLPTARGGLGGVALDGQIYTYGGEEPGFAHGTHEAYDPATDTWESLPDLPGPRHGSAVAAVGGRIYVIGGGPSAGFSQSTAVQVFTP